MLSKFDDYPIHQTAQPITIPASSDRNVYDRYWFNGYDRDGDFYFGIGLALYPNLRIMDCGVSIIRGGEQHAPAASVHELHVGLAFKHTAAAPRFNDCALESSCLQGVV